MIFEATGKKKKEISLRVQEPDPTHVGRNIVTLDRQTKEFLGITSGDVVELEGNKITSAIVWPARAEDEGKSIIRMDNLIRHNCGIGLGEKVLIRKADYKEAKKIVLAPTQEVRIIASGYDRILKKTFIGRSMHKGDHVWISVFGSGFIYSVVDTLPKGIVKVTDFTQFVLREEPVKEAEEVISRVAYEDIGGLSEAIKKIREMIELPMRHPELFRKLGIQPPKGVLLHGPPGTGKTLLAKAVANETQAHFISVNGPEVMSKFVGEAEERLRQIFKEAEENAPSIIFFDEIDAIAPKREEVIGEVERRVVAQLLALMDGMEARGNVIVIAATNRLNSLDEALRRPGRFDREIEIGVPDKNGRKEILQIHTRGMPLSKDINLDSFAATTHGFVGADLAALAKESAMKALRRYLPKINLEEETIPAEVLESLEVNKKDFNAALKEVQPSALREVAIEIPNVRWRDIGALENVKDELKKVVEWPLKYPDSFKKMGVRPPRGILLYGPPGCGKTLLAKAIATEAEANFITIKGPELLCVAKDTNIFTDFCGVEKIENFYQKIIPLSTKERLTDTLEVRRLKKPIHTLTITENGDLIKSKIKTVHKLWVDQSYTVKLSNNCKITGSKNQPLLVFRDNLIKWVPLEGLKVGDYVAYPLALPALDKKIKINLPEYKHLRKVKEDQEKYYVKIFSTKTITALPKYLTKELASFLGWFVSEGSITKEGISICNHDKKNQKEIKELFQQFVDKSRITSYKDKVVVYSTALVKYLEEIFEQKLGTKKSYTIKCPGIITKASEEIIQAFLRAAFKGDGCLTKTKIEYSTKSKQLAEGMAYLLTLLGIKYRFWQRKDELFMITVSGKQEMNKFKASIFDLRTENKIRKAYNAQYHVPPVSGLLKEAKKRLRLRYDKELPDGSFEHAISGRRKIGLIRLRRIMEIFDRYSDKAFKKSQLYKTLNCIVKGTVLWAQVQNKKKAKPQTMYDVETKHGSFIGGNTPLILHNSKWVGESEKGIRKIFRRARQVSPAIVFFDEIDSVASVRGTTFDSGVSERVVNQLLTELDGIEDIKDVVFIAATNRPDLIDPGLLRPGRIDKIVEVPTPDEKAREEIFKVHVKNVPLEKNVNLKVLAEKTKGYSGADIAGLVREAVVVALKENKMKPKPVSMKNFETALKKILPSISTESAEAYKDFREEISKFRPSYVR